MKTKEEIRQEISELYGSRTMIQEIMDDMHTKSMDITKKMFALNQMLREMNNEELGNARPTKRH